MMVDRMNLEKAYQEVYQLITKVDFSKLWNNFQPIPFAIYNENQCFFAGKYIEKTEAFIANTAIDYQGQIIAIWRLEEEDNYEILASKLIHEMFHGFQMRNQESRFPNEMDAIYNYQYLDQNLSLKLEENKLIVDLINQFQLKNFTKLLGIRQYRYQTFPYEFNYEAKIEQIEGTANYIELQALKQLSESLYLKKRNQMLDKIIQPANLLPIRIISYDIGASFILLAKENRLDLYQDFSGETIAERMIASVEPIEITCKESIQEFINLHFQKAKAVVDQAIANQEIILEGNYNILGINMYDAVYLAPYIISTYFIMVGEKNNPVIEYGDFVIETKQKGISSKIYRIKETNRSGIS